MTRNTESADTSEGQGTDEADGQSRSSRVRSAVTKRGRNGTAAAVGGGLLLASAARAVARSRRRAVALVLGGGALVAAALQQRRSGDDSQREEGAESTGADDGTSKVSAEAHAHRMAASTLNRTKAGPRGVDGEPDVDTETDPDEGRVRFSTGQDEATEQKPHIDEVDPKDPRYPDEGEPGSEDPVDVSLSSTKMTDELGKVAGPDDDQAYPSREGTDPEPMSGEAPPRYGEGAVANPDSDEADDQTDEETQAGEETQADAKTRADDESESRDEESA